MITDNEKFIEIQGILAFSDIHPADCIKINSLIIELSKEIHQLKKQLEEINKMIEKGGFVNIEQVILSYCGLIAQQKEFINYLENGIDICDGFLDTVKSDSQEIPYGVISASKTYITTRIKEHETAHKVYEEILQKYEEIIGVSDEKKRI